MIKTENNIVREMKETGYYRLDLYLAPWTQKHCRIMEIKNRPEHPLHANASIMGEGRTNCSCFLQSLSNTKVTRGRGKGNGK